MLSLACQVETFEGAGQRYRGTSLQFKQAATASS